MRNFIEKFLELYSDLIQVSRLTKTKNKKIKIILLALLVNLTVFLDILIIIYFSTFFTYSPNIEIYLIDYFLSNQYFLPIFIILRFLFIYFEKVAISNLQFDVERNLREYLISEVFKRGNISTSDAFFYVNILSSHVGNFYQVFTSLLGSIVQILTFTIYLLFSNFQAVLIFSIGTVLLIIPTFYLTKLARKFAHVTYTTNKKVSDNVEKIIDNLFLIKILNKASFEINSFKNLLQKYYFSRVSEIKVGTIAALMPNFFTAFLLSILLVFFNFGKLLTLDFIGILLRLFQSLGVFNKNVNFVTVFHVYLQKIHEIEKNKEFILSEKFIIEDHPEEDVAIEFKDVNFQYLGSETDLFQDLSFKIYKNKHTIITGFNGAGKSTLLGLMSGVLYPTKGAIKSSSENFGYVSASPMIINDTLRNNILYGNDTTKIKDLEILEYLTEFKVFNTEAEQSLDNVVSNKSLSMGQMQKISFIRALISGVEILILDESTSNLDTESRELILKILESKTITIINSTHSKDELKSFDYHLQIQDDNGRRLLKYV